MAMKIVGGAGIFIQGVKNVIRSPDPAF